MSKRAQRWAQHYSCRNRSKSKIRVHPGRRRMKPLTRANDWPSRHSRVLPSSYIRGARLVRLAQMSNLRWGRECHCIRRTFPCASSHPNCKFSNLWRPVHPKSSLQVTVQSTRLWIKKLRGQSSTQLKCRKTSRRKLCTNCWRMRIIESSITTVLTPRSSNKSNL